MNRAPTPTPVPPSPDISLWYHYGPQGETRQLTNRFAIIADTYTYDAYGIPLSSAGNDYNPHRYGGKFGYHNDLSGAGLMLAGARWYSPNLRRWISRDPIGYAGGENLHRYVKDQPTKLVDPTGTWDVAPPIDGVGAGLDGAGSLVGGVSLAGAVEAGAVVGIAAGTAAAVICNIDPELCTQIVKTCDGEELKEIEEQGEETKAQICSMVAQKLREKCNSKPVVEKYQCLKDAADFYRVCMRYDAGIGDVK